MDNIKIVLDAVAAMMKRLFEADMPDFARHNVSMALAHDLAIAGRLPTEAECAIMMGSDEDDDEEDLERDPHLYAIFPKTYEELEALWQLGRPHRW